MKMKYVFTILAVLLMVSSSCDRTRSSTGWDYMPDMYYSDAYETYTPNENFEDGLTMRTPVAGTVPREMVPFAYEKTDGDRILAGEELVNPVPLTRESIASGSKLYGVFCLTCHGEEGDGQGYLYTSQRYPFPPASLVNKKVQALSDGEIYHTITVGYGVMGPHGAMIPQQDRWKIINYIRSELQ
ncbi:MAG: cytochrome c [Bacteroidales bacterium]|nr:cytochrome c [Bacteroidales bacterium]